MDSEAVVVGASAVGGVCAKELSSLGVQTLLLEEHPAPGKFHKCSGIMSKKGLASLGVSLDGIVLNEVKGARLFSERHELKIATSHSQAVVINRQAFDERAVFEAQEAGAKLVCNSRAEKFSSKGGTVSVQSKSGTHSAKFLVGCDGASSTVAREFGFPKLEAKDFVSAWEGEFTGLKVGEPDLVQLYFDQKLFTNFFGWLIPVDETTARIGFATNSFESIRASKEAFLKSNLLSGAEFGSASCACAREFNYVIPIKMRPKTQLGNVLLCGDAAGQVKATTGGGVVFGGKCAKIAAACVSESIKTGKPLDYETRWRKSLGKNLRMHELIRSAYSRMNDSLISAFLFLAGIGLKGAIERFGDMDFIVKE
ncbi:NAD(P)/FAD-dependent oxidoreductase [Candidatus Micrarchaeota archaeon]|nr:NAD(P)/FAD-dependent oxidoreductase [Candidatus Micrarchaeota archaeon]MBI5176889.1 NAD(P)/FAD-dependent oxidoreductase [Candidatus Micrarchaeota archaeon]